MWKQYQDRFSRLSAIKDVMLGTSHIIGKCYNLRLKPEWSGSPLAQEEKYQEKKTMIRGGQLHDVDDDDDNQGLKWRSTREDGTCNKGAATTTTTTPF
jgi:hypothetical protein